jgi:Na+/proline symporter
MECQSHGSFLYGEYLPMHLNAIDWIIVGTFLCILFAVALYVSRFNRSVADFLTANRCARRVTVQVW